MTSALAAVAMVLSPAAATPVAAAEQDELLRLLLGLGAAAVVAKVLADRADEGDDRASDRSRRSGSERADRRGLPRIDGQPSRMHRQALRTLPQSCERSVSGRFSVIVLPRSCLREAGVITTRLPDECSFRARTGVTTKQVYGLACLERLGWTTRPPSARSAHRWQGY